MTQETPFYERAIYFISFWIFVLIFIFGGLLYIYGTLITNTFMSVAGFVLFPFSGFMICILFEHSGIVSKKNEVSS
jgi:hypothetical protein